jgi:hypothetical protein
MSENHDRDERVMHVDCKTFGTADAILADGTPVYLKTTQAHGDYSTQMALYEMLFGYNRAMSKD